MIKLTPLSALCLAGSALFSILSPAAAQSPTQTSIVVPYPAGGGSDFIARTFAPALAQALDQTVIIENLSGAGGAVGSHRLLQRPADRSEEHTSELQSLMRISYAVFCLNTKTQIRCRPLLYQTRQQKTTTKTHTTNYQTQT